MKPIWMKSGEARCIGACCTHPKKCARKEMPPQQGRPLGDYSRPSHQLWVPVECCAPSWHRFVSLDDAVEPAGCGDVKEWIGRA